METGPIIIWVVLLVIFVVAAYFTGRRHCNNAWHRAAESLEKKGGGWGATGSRWRDRPRGVE